MAEKRKRAPGGGRKPLPVSERRSETLTVRVRPKLKRDLERALKGGRTLSEEIERRLEQSLQEPRRDMWGDDSIRRFAVLMAGVAYWTQEISKQSWRNDPWTFKAIVAGINFLLPVLAPKGKPLPPPTLRAILDLFEDEGPLPADHDLRLTLTDPVRCGERAALQVASYMHGDEKDIEGLFVEDVRKASRGLGIKPSPDVIPELIAALSANQTPKESKS